MLQGILGTLGSIGGIDIGILVAALGYCVRTGVEIRSWCLERREGKILDAIKDAIQWVYVNKVQAAKAAAGKLTPEEAHDALATATFKAVEFAHNAGIDLREEVGESELPGRVQEVFARLKADIRPAA